MKSSERLDSVRAILESALDTYRENVASYGEELASMKEDLDAHNQAVSLSSQEYLSPEDLGFIQTHRLPKEEEDHLTTVYEQQVNEVRDLRDDLENFLVDVSCLVDTISDEARAWSDDFEEEHCY